MDRIVKGIWIPIEIWQDTDLSWNEKILLMEIDSFTSKGKECYISNEYIADLLGVGERTAKRYIAHLLDRKLVKVVRFDGRARYLETAIAYDPAEVTQMSPLGGQKCHPTYNNRPNNGIDKSIPNTHKGNAFDFRKSFIDLGVAEEVIDTWMAVRKRKRAVDSEIAFSRIKAEIDKTGLSANECITIAVANSWQGFNSAWVERQQPRRSAPQQRESTFAHNLKVMDKMFGTNMHEQAYGKKEGNIDEQ